MAGYGHHVYSSWINRQGGAGRGVPRRGKAEKGRGAEPRGGRGRVRGHVAGGTRRLSCCWPSVRRSVPVLAARQPGGCGEVGLRGLRWEHSAVCSASLWGSGTHREWNEGKVVQCNVSSPVF